MFEQVQRLSPTLFTTTLTPEGKRMLTGGAAAKGAQSVFLVHGIVQEQPTGGLGVDAAALVPLNQGWGEEAVFICEPAAQPAEIDATSQGEDAAFVREVRRLVPPLEAIADHLLTRLRAKYPGKLWRSKNGVFVNAPSNFFTFRVQPRVRNVRVDVYGHPHQFALTDAQAKSISLRPGRASYSYFFFDKADVIPMVEDVIHQSHKLKHG